MGRSHFSQYKLLNDTRQGLAAWCLCGRVARSFEKELNTGLEKVGKIRGLSQKFKMLKRNPSDL